MPVGKAAAVACPKKRHTDMLCSNEGLRCCVHAPYYVHVVSVRFLPFLLNGRWGTGRHDQKHPGDHRFETGARLNSYPHDTPFHTDFTSVDFVAEETASRNFRPMFNTNQMLCLKMPSIGSDGKSTPPGQQSICSKCNRNFRRAADAKRNSDEYERCGLCRNSGVGEWLQESCVVS
ncbi:unnamed protein product [Ectocarpus sp. 4 AP-2014]